MPAMIIAKTINIGDNTSNFNIAATRLKNKVNIMISFHSIYYILHYSRIKIRYMHLHIPLKSYRY